MAPLTISKQLSALEATIVRNEFNAPVIATLDANERWIKLRNVWSEIKLVAGVLMHEGADLQLQLTVLEKFLLSHPKYHRLTDSEIRHAFYMNHQGVFGEPHKHFNRELNCEFVGDVLNSYLGYKAKMYRSKLGLIQKALQPSSRIYVPLERPTPDQLRAEIQRDYDLYRNGQANQIIVVKPKYQYLRKIKAIRCRDKAMYYGWYSVAIDSLKNKALAKKYKERTTAEHLIKIYEGIQQEGTVPLSQHRVIVNELYRLLYLDLFLIFKETAINKIFTDIKF